MAVPRLSEFNAAASSVCGEKRSETSTSEAVEALAKELSLTDEDLKEMLPSGIQSTLLIELVGHQHT